MSSTRIGTTPDPEARFGQEAPHALDSYRVHSAMGAINELAFQVNTQAAKAASFDPFGLHAERALEAIGRLEAHLAGLRAELSPEHCIKRVA